MSIVKGMIEQRRLAAHARCRVKSWKLTELQAWELADEIRWLQPEFRDVRRPAAAEIVKSMKRGEVRVLGAQVDVQ